MQGMIGLIIQNNVLANTVQIGNQVGNDRYLCRFETPPPFNRVVHLEEIQQWLLFMNPQEMQTWIDANKDPDQPLPPGAAPPADPPGDDGGEGNGQDEGDVKH